MDENIKNIVREEIIAVLSESKVQLVDYFTNFWVNDKNVHKTLDAYPELKFKYGSYLNYGRDEWNSMSEEDLMKIWSEWDKDYSSTFKKV